ncbi:MAG: hypothetical protein A2076_02570 [Geobacteraceae bacterium GWC2_53_11]|nr:MAG: hypothetical protein A2076_02570 [Geobacteraceae bacterium GWC2_53_11]
MIKFMAEYEARKDINRLNQLINTSMVVYMVLSILFCFIFISILPFVINRILCIPILLQEKANHIFTIAIILFFANMVMGVFGSLIIGFQQMGYSNLIGLASTVITACGTFAFISNGYGLHGLVYNNALVTLVVAIFNFYAAKLIFPGMCLNPFKYFNKDILKMIFGFSWKVQVSNITQLLVYQVDRVLLSHYVGLEAVSFYEISYRIASQARGFITSIFSPILPAASALHAVEGNDKIVGLYKRSFKYMAITVVPFMTLLIALAHPFMRTWMGAEYDTSAITMQLLLIAYTITLFTGPGSFILSGINKPQVGMKSSAMAGLTNLTLCWLLVQTVGYYGIIIGIATSMLTSGIYFIFMVHKNISGINWQLYPQTLIKPFLVSTSLAIFIPALDVLLPIKGYISLFTISTVYLTLAGMLLLRGNYFDEFDRKTMALLIPFRRMGL